MKQIAESIQKLERFQSVIEGRVNVVFALNDIANFLYNDLQRVIDTLKEAQNELDMKNDHVGRRDHSNT